MGNFEAVFSVCGHLGFRREKAIEAFPDHLLGDVLRCEPGGETVEDDVAITHDGDFVAQFGQFAKTM